MLCTAAPLAAAAAVLVLATTIAAHPLAPETPPSVSVSVRVGVSVSAAPPRAADITAENQFWITQLTDNVEFAEWSGQQWCCLGGIRARAMGLNISVAEVMSSNLDKAMVQDWMCERSYDNCYQNFDQVKWVKQGRNLNVVLTRSHTDNFYAVTAHEVPQLPLLAQPGHPFAVVQLAQPAQE